MTVIVRFLTICWTVGALLLAPETAYAHKSNMAVLQIEKITKITTGDVPHSYQVRYSFSGLASSQLPRPILPTDCKPITTLRERKTNTTLGLAWSISCDNQLLGREIRFIESDVRLEQVIYSLVDTENNENSAAYTAEKVFNQLPQPIVLYENDLSINQNKSTDIDSHYSNSSNAKFVMMGAEHMFWGLDHVFFVILLVLILRYSKNLLLGITGFTLGHSITLIFAVSNTLSLPTAPVEALIALSIVFLAAEGLNQHHGKPTILSRKPLLVTVSFGLLHGLGFAGAISDINIPESMFIPAVFCFNMGIELAQLTIVTILYPLSLISRQVLATFKTVPFRLAGVISGFWFVERAVAVVLQ